MRNTEWLRRAIVLTATFGLVLCVAPRADAGGFYFAGQVGLGMYEDLEVDLSNAFNDEDTELNLADQTHAVWGLAMGYQVNQYFGVEIGWTDLGKAKDKDGTANYEGLKVIATGAYPITDWLAITAGVGSWWYTVDLNGSLVLETEEGPVDIKLDGLQEDGVALSIFTGLRFPIWGPLHGRVAYERYFDVRDGDVDTATFTLLYAFGGVEIFGAGGGADDLFGL